MGKVISEMVRAGNRTYFFDLKDAKTGKKLLILTESLWAGDGRKYQRNRIVLFPEQAKEFARKVKKLTLKLV
jgi:hypothetical protein